MIRARIVLLAADGLTNCAIAERLGICDGHGPVELPVAGLPRHRPGIAAVVSASTAYRWLAADVLRPWRHRSWIFPRDPYFASKAKRLLDLHQRTWGGQPPGEDEYVLSAD